MSPCRQNRDVIVAWSLIGGPFLRRKPAFMCVVSATSVSPSQRPVVKPPRVCSAYFDGCGRPSIQMMIGARSSHAPIVNETMALDRIGVAPDLQAERPLHEVDGRPAFALALDHRQLRFVVAQRPRAAFVVEREPQVVHRVRVARDVFGVARRPRAGEVGLRERAVRQRRRQQREAGHRSDPSAGAALTMWMSTVWDPIWNRPLPS